MHQSADIAIAPAEQDERLRLAARPAPNYPEPDIEPIRGWKRAVIWAALLAGSWGLMIGIGYGVYGLVGLLTS
jgi:hypothetical protein